MKILLAKLKNLYLQYAWVSIMKKQNSNENVKVEKMVVFVKTWLLQSQVWFSHLFKLSFKTVKEFETEI